VSRTRALTKKDFAKLLEFRVALRRFLGWSEDQAAEVSLSAAQHQLLLAICGHDDPRGPTVSDIAGYLVVRHHSAIGLINRAQDGGLLQRRTDDDDQRVVRLSITPLGQRRVDAMAAAHIEELRRLAPLLDALLEVAGD
jgi:DNA-binding MarR family transcriptional regulator